MLEGLSISEPKRLCFIILKGHILTAGGRSRTVIRRERDRLERQGRGCCALPIPRRRAMTLDRPPPNLVPVRYIQPLQAGTAEEDRKTRSLPGRR